MTSEKWVYEFAEGSRDMRELLGGKGANVAEMTRVLGDDRVPPGFTITTEACVAYMRERTSPTASSEQVAEALARLEQTAGKRFGDDQDPLLVSVRSGARESMPGMLDTILNVGLNDSAVEGLAAATGNERFAWDSYRRLVQMFGNVAHGVPSEKFEDAIAAAKREEGVTNDTELSVDGLRELVATLQGLLRLPRRRPRAAGQRDSRGVRVLDRRARGLLSADQPDPRRLGHGGQRAADGVREHGRQLGHRRRVQPRRGDRRARPLGRLPDRRPGRGRRVGGTHPARPARAQRRRCPRPTSS